MRLAERQLKLRRHKNERQKKEKDRLTKQAEKKEKKKAVESQKEELGLLAEGEVACHEEEKHAQKTFKNIVRLYFRMLCLTYQHVWPSFLTQTASIRSNCNISLNKWKKMTSHPSINNKYAFTHCLFF